MTDEERDTANAALLLNETIETRIRESVERILTNDYIVHIIMNTPAFMNMKRQIAEETMHLVANEVYKRFEPSRPGYSSTTARYFR